MQYAGIGRFLAILSAIGMPAVALWQFTVDVNSVPLGVYLGAIAVLIGVIEIPYICSCFKWCVVLAKYSKFIAGWWAVRAIIYIGMSAGGYAIYQVQTKNNLMLVSLIVLTLAAAFMIVATVMREENPYSKMMSDKEGAADTGASKATSTAGGSGAAATSSGAGGMFGGLFTGAAATKAQNAAVGAAAGAAAKSMGESLFGAKDEEAMQAAPVKAAASAPAPAASMFGGGALFGGSTSKYGYASDLPEANPFVSSGQ